MGLHRGYRISKNPNGTFKAWPWDPIGQRYAHMRSGFAKESEAKAYAQDEHAKFRSKLQSSTRATTKNLVEAYEKHLLEVKQRSRSHLANVKRALGHLKRACPDPQHPRAAIAVEEHLAKLEVSARTKVQFLVTIKALGNWCVLKRLLQANPWTVCETAEPGDPVKEQFTIDELRTMVLAVDDPYWWDAVTFIYTGMRSSESQTAREAIDLGGGVILVVGKGRGERRKERLVPIQHEYRALLLAELARRPTGPLAAHSHKQHRNRFPDFLKRLGLSKRGRTVHSWRHCYAGLMTATGEPTASLQAHMGHTSPKTTAGYSSLATRYRQAAAGWERGQFQLLRGAASKWPREAAERVA
jgi:integrase